VTLYTKPGCHLCWAMRGVLAAVAKRWRIDVEEVDVTNDPLLLARYRDDLPVVVVGDALFRHFATERALERVLAEKGASLR
jgi:glutaredoxin